MNMKKKLVVLTGAGISAESGLKTFRDSDGLWEGYNVYEVATPRGFAANPQLVLDFYNARRKDVANALPNAAHTILADLENYFDVQIITQNIDDLHERGGSKKVLHLHGEITKICSVHNKQKTYAYTSDLLVGNVDENGHQLRPFIVWFEEEVPMIPIAAELAANADIFIIVGTSLQVYPAAGLINYVPNNVPVFIIDKTIPPINTSRKIIAIENTASKGLAILQKQLIEKYINN
jgi:NAD-dependent deacetylase